MLLLSFSLFFTFIYPFKAFSPCYGGEAFANENRPIPDYLEEEASLFRKGSAFVTDADAGEGMLASCDGHGIPEGCDDARAFAVIGSREMAEKTADDYDAVLSSYENGVAVYALSKGYSETIKDAEGKPGIACLIVPDTILSPADEPVIKASLESATENNWQLDQANVFDAWNITKGAGAKIAVIDTGVLASHENIRTNLVSAVNASSLSDNGQGIDTADHGTPVAGIIAGTLSTNSCFGVAPESSIYSIRITDGSGEYASTSNLISAINECIEKDIDVINISMCAGYTREADQASKAALEMAVNMAWLKGITVVCAAGNDGGDEPRYPAAFENTIAVGALTKDQNGGLMLSDSSNFGSWVDVYAPGSMIYAPSGKSEREYRYMSGTSAASPQVAGAAALLYSKFDRYKMKKNRDTAQEVRHALLNATDGVTYPGRGGKTVKGCFDAYKAINVITIIEKRNGYCCSTSASPTPVSPGKSLPLSLAFYDGGKVKKGKKAIWNVSDSSYFSIRKGVLKCKRTAPAGTEVNVTALYNGYVYSASFVTGENGIGQTLSDIKESLKEGGPFYTGDRIVIPSSVNGSEYYMSNVKSQKDFSAEKDSRGRVLAFIPGQPGKYKVILSPVNGTKMKKTVAIHVK